MRREHDIAVPLALALFDPQRHALAVDVRHLQGHDLGDAQARAIGDAERGLVLQAGRGFEQEGHLFLAQHHRRPARLMHASEMAGEFRPFERDVEEEPQRGDGGVDGRRADLLLGHMQLIEPDVLSRGGVRRTAEKDREVPHVAEIILLNLLLEAARGHVLDHALAQRAVGLVDHRESSCLAWG